MASTLVTAVEHHPVNRTGRDFVVGDLHGCVDALRYLLREAAFDPSRDRLFSVGDLIDRGTQSEEALALLDKPWFYAVLGNHEDTLCAVAEGRLRRQWWYGIGGTWAAQLSDEKLRHYAQRLSGLPPNSSEPMPISIPASFPPTSGSNCYGDVSSPWATAIPRGSSVCR